MRIGINLIPLRPGHMGGAEMYLRDLLAELLDAGGHEYLLVTADYNHDTLPGDARACRRLLFSREAAVPRGGLRRIARALAPVTRRLDRARRWYSRRAADSLRGLIRREQLDLWFCPFTNLEPRITPVPGVITVFDLQHEYHPEFFDADELDNRRRFYPESCAAADHVIAISEFTRRCIVDRYGVDRERTSSIWLAPGSDFDWRGAQEQVRRVRETYSLPSRYAFYPANTWHHKNHRRLIEAMARYHAQHGEDLGLVLTGAGKEGGQGLAEAVVEQKLDRLVRVLGYVPRADLPALYAGAACLVFPSLFEGFGIPLVEAMLVGCPIAAAGVTSIPEVVGDAGVLFDPLNPEDIARAVAAVVRDREAAADLARRGRARAELFAASRMARQTLEVFDRVSRGERPGRAGIEMILVDGVYEDQWTGREVMLVLRGAALVSLELEGDLPGFSALVPQRLEVRVGGRESLVVSLEKPGPFSLTVPLPSNGAPSCGWEVSVVSLKTFRPKDHGISDDGRDLGVRLRLVRVLLRDGRQVTKVLGTTEGPE